MTDHIPFISFIDYMELKYGKWWYLMHQDDIDLEHYQWALLPVGENIEMEIQA